MLLDKYFQQIFVISLPYKPERRERLAAHFRSQSLGDPAALTWIRAISGEWCWPPAWFHAGGGAWGCLQSHMRIVQDAIMDGLENYLVLEDDVIFHGRSAELLDRFMTELPDDWDQIYLGGQHLRGPEPLPGRPFVFRPGNVNRTHAFALKRSVFARFQQHIAHAPDYIARNPWHIDHQLGLAHERRYWNTYCPAWWIAGQDAGPSNVSGRINPPLWWHPSLYSQHLPFIFVPPNASENERRQCAEFLHCGYHLKEGTLEDIGLDSCVESSERLRDWLTMVAREAIDRALLPGIQHPRISLKRVTDLWPAGVNDLPTVTLEELADYPFNELFPHPVNSREQDAFHLIQTSNAA
jgi:Glycosyltransferase family 25 (LPS biosynthesis protein)